MFLKVSLWKICRATVDSFTPMYIGTARTGQWIIKKKKGIKTRGDYIEGKIRVEGKTREWILLEHGQKNDSW